MIHKRSRIEETPNWKRTFTYSQL